MNAYQTKIARIEKLLDSANGRRRSRTMPILSVAQCVREAIRDEIGGANGGTVAASYGYPAETTRCATIRLADGSILVDIGTGNASKNGGYAVTGPYQWNQKCLRRCLEWAEANRSLANLVVLSKSEAARFVRDQCGSTKWGACPAGLAEIVVTADDSLDAGNCRPETVRVAEALARSGVVAGDSIRGADLWAWCAANEPPTLRPFVVRAIQQAARKVTA